MKSKTKVSKRVLTERNQNMRVATHQSDSFFSKPIVAYLGLFAVFFILLIASNF